MILYGRDASFFCYPGKARRYHVKRTGVNGPFGHTVAMCSNRIQLDDDNYIDSDRAGVLICKRCSKYLITSP